MEIPEQIKNTIPGFTHRLHDRKTNKTKKMDIQDVSGKISTLKHRQKNGWKIQINK